MNAIIWPLVAILVVGAVLAAVYVVGVVLSVLDQEKRRREALIRQQWAEARIDAASFRAMQQMLEAARQAQDPERRF